MMKRCLSLLLAVVLIAVLAVPVSADEGNAGGWTELLEFSSIRDDGSNYVNFTGTTTSLSIPLYSFRRVAKIDMLLRHNSDVSLKVTVSFGDNTINMNTVALDSGTSRVYGEMPGGYHDELIVTITSSFTGTNFVEFQSCRITSLRTIDYVADAYLYRSFSDSSPLKCPNNFTVAGVANSINTKGLLLPVVIKDWRKYDSITIFGSFTQMALNSFRPSVGNKGLPFEITYTVSNPTGTAGIEQWQTSSFFDIANGYSDGEGTVNTDLQIEYHGNILYTITIDLTGVDRALTGDLNCYFTLVYDESVGYAANVQGVTGSVTTADTSSVSWWSRFTDFMTDLFGGDDPAADEFQSDMEQQGQEMQDAVDQLDQVTKPAVSDIDVDLSGIVSNSDLVLATTPLTALLQNELFFSMALISLTLALVAYVLYGKR